MPPFSRVEEESAWANLWNTRGWNSAGMPGPRSVTVTRASLPRRCAETTTGAWGGENFAALERRLAATCIKRSESARTQRSPGAPASTKETPSWLP